MRYGLPVTGQRAPYPGGYIGDTVPVMEDKRAFPRWPLFLIGAPAAVAIWSGWVGLGTLCGFGVIHPLPGIWDGLRLNTAITLPVGVEAYATYALGAWLSPRAVPAAARRWAKLSAIAALLLGMTGQAAYHLLNAAGTQRAPWPVVVVVSCMPVVVLGCAAALTHLLRTRPDTASADTADTPDTAPDTASPLASEVVEPFLEDLARGEVPGIRRIRAELSCGQPRAQDVQRKLAALAEAG
jgi:hypothetical protein